MIGKIALGLITLLLLLCNSVSAQTKMQLGAYWDNGSQITGTVTLAHNCVLTNGKLTCSTVDYLGKTAGWVTLSSVQLVTDTLYQVTIVTSNPSTKQSVAFTFPFMLPSGVISPANVVAASCRLTISQATNEVIPGGMVFTVTL
jgi:hypothetical protein